MSSSDSREPRDSSSASPEDADATLDSGQRRGERTPSSGPEIPLDQDEDGLFLGPYRIEAELGRGGMGIVYRAFDPRLARRIAIKLLRRRIAEDPAWCQQLEAEARLLASINHPNIATIHSLERSDAKRFLTMEFVEGESLQIRLRSGPVPADEALADARQIASALEAAHARGIVHCDLKPSNVIRRPDGLTKVIDFGIARLEASKAGAADADAVSGTPGYMSPEQIRAEPIDGRSDLFALGALLFECLSGTAAFPGTSVQERLEATLHRAPSFERIPDDVSTAVRELVERCLSVDREGRPADAAEARRILETEVVAHRLARERRAGRPAPLALPQTWTSFVGRESIRQELLALVRSNRLVTLAGFGGCGKTRLALQAAELLGGEYADGVCWVDLTALTDGALLWLTLGRALQLRESPEAAQEESVLAYLEPRSMLLVLDNCEHLVSAVAPVVERIRKRAPSLRILTTSREHLLLAGEAVLNVPPLVLPAAGSTDLAEIAEAEAVRLFVARARAASNRFVFDEGTAPFVADVCRRLEGIPLALELAAARLRVLGIADLADRLSNRFQILRSSSKGAAPHHQTLEAMVEWSYGLLSPEEALLLRRLSVFAGGWTLEAAEDVCALDGIEGWQILDLTSALLEKSLIEIDAEKQERSDVTRYRMLETVREFAATRLRTTAEAERIALRHAECFTRLCGAMSAGLLGAGESAWRARFELDLENVRSALRRSEESSEARRAAIILAAQAGRCYDVVGAWTEGRLALQRLVDAVPREEQDFDYARVLGLVGSLALNQGDLPVARAAQERSLEILRRVGSQEAIMSGLGNLANVLTEQGEYGRAVEMYRENLRLAREVGHRWAEAAALGNLSTALLRFDLDAAVIAARDGLVLFEELGNAWAQCFSHINLSLILGGREDYAASQHHAERALAIAHELGDRRGLGLALQQVARNAVAQGRWEDARSALGEALGHIGELGDQIGIVTILEAAMRLAVERKDDEFAACFLGAAERMRAALQMPRPPDDQQSVDQAEAIALARTGAERWAELRARVHPNPLDTLRSWLAAP